MLKRGPRPRRAIGLVPGVIIPDGPHQGTWRRYRPWVGRRASWPRLGWCERCRARVADVGAAGWGYSRGRIGGATRQLCADCLELLASWSERLPDA